MQASTEGMKDDPSETAAKRKTSVAILISDKADFKPKNLTRDKDGQYLMIKMTMHQEDINSY